MVDWPGTGLPRSGIAPRLRLSCHCLTQVLIPLHRAKYAHQQFIIETVTLSKTPRVESPGSSSIASDRDRDCDRDHGRDRGRDPIFTKNVRILLAERHHGKGLIGPVPIPRMGLWCTEHRPSGSCPHLPISTSIYPPMFLSCTHLPGISASRDVSTLRGTRAGQQI